MVKEKFLDVKTAAVADQTAVFTDDPVAGNQYRQLIAVVCHAYRTAGFGIANHPCLFGIGDGFSIGNPAQRLPALQLKGCAGWCKRKGEATAFPREVLVQLTASRQKQGSAGQGIANSGGDSEKQVCEPSFIFH